jgi:hypothetical protein
MNPGNKGAEIFDKKALEQHKKDKVKEWEEVDELIRVVMPTLASLKPILTDQLYFSSRGILKGWKKRFAVLTQDNWIYYFTNNDPKGHARASIPINSETTVRELFDPISVIPYFIEITSNWPVDSKNRRFIVIGCDNKQKCQSWVTSIKSLIARDKFSNAKLPPKPGMEEDDEERNTNNNIPSGISTPPSVAGSLGSLYDEITGYSSNNNNNINNNNNSSSNSNSNNTNATSIISNNANATSIPSHRSNNSHGGSGNYSDVVISSPILSPKISPQVDYHTNAIKKNAKNIRITKHPARKESFRPRYANMMNVNLSASSNGSRTPRLNSSNAQSTIPMISSSPLMKGQMPSSYSPYSNSGSISPISKGLNGFSLTSPSLKPMNSISSSAINGNPKINVPGYRHSPLLSANDGMGRVVSSINSPLLSPKQKPINSPFLQAQAQVQPPISNYNIEEEDDDDVDFNFGLGSPMNMNMNMNMSLSNMNLGMANMEFDQAKLIQQQRMQEQLIKQQQQQIFQLQQQLLKNQKEMEQGVLDMPKDKNFF